MSWFGEQIRNRIKRDRDLVSDSLLQIADALSSKERFRARISSKDILCSEIERICNYYKLKASENTPASENVNDIIDCLIRPLGIMRRRILLEDKWWKNGDGPLLAVIKDSGEMCALIPRKLSGYIYYDRKTLTYTKVTASNKDRFDVNAICFYRPLPAEKMSGKDLVSFLIRKTSLTDTVMIILSILFVTLLGIITPAITRIVFSQIIPAQKRILVISAALLLSMVAIGTYLLTTVKTAILSRIINRMDTMLENGLIARTLNLPVKYFSDKSSGALSQSLGFLMMLPDILTNLIFNVGITVCMSLLYIVQIFLMAPALSIPALITFALEIVLVVICMKQKRKLIREQLDADMAAKGLVFALFSGIQKIKLSGSENRAFAKWAHLYRRKARATYRRPFPSFMQNELMFTVQMVGMLFVYASAADNHVSVAQFAAFLSSFGMVMAALMNLSSNSDSNAFLSPILEAGEIILQAVPENSGEKRIVENLSGTIELDNVTFSYDEDGRRIIDELNLKIDSGEYIAIVGKSGCGKSTLMRLMLGFETPDEGTINYGGRNLSTLDMASFRRNIGTVMQSGKLFAGDIFSNITISAPWLNMDDAWEAARLAGMEDDILNMPMGMHTLISEGSGGISGGQRQRLMIARAIAPKPSILMFDEATSALDNITQKTVSDSLSRLNCTRIVIAHRLSTIRECDRIIVLDGGKIVEEGSYEELMAKEGFFADLVRRQQVDF